MGESMNYDEKQGCKFTVTISEESNGWFTARMTCKGRKTTWVEPGRTKDEAKSKVLVYLRDAIRPFVRVP